MMKYAKGEQVILQSRRHSEYNGEYTVSECLGKRYTEDETIGNSYRLEGVPHVWDESALRKKYDKGMGFNELMESLEGVGCE